MIDFNTIYNHSTRLPVLHGYNDVSDVPDSYINNIKYNIRMHDKVNSIPCDVEKLIGTHVIKNNSTGVEIMPLDTKISTRLYGKFAVVHFPQIGHHAHDLFDFFPRIEFFRQTKNTAHDITYILLDQPKHNRSVKETVNRLQLLHNAYKQCQIMIMPVDATWSITGELHLFTDQKEVNLFHSCKRYTQYISHHRTEPPGNDVIFVPRHSHDTRHSRHQSDEEIQKISSVLSDMFGDRFRVFDYKQYNTPAAQKTFFSTASIIIGCHGTGMSNMIWPARLRTNDKPLHVIEITGCTTLAEKIETEHSVALPIQRGNDTALWMKYSGMNIQHHHMFHDFNSIDPGMISVNIDTLLSAIQTINES